MSGNGTRFAMWVVVLQGGSVADQYVGPFLRQVEASSWAAQHLDEHADWKVRKIHAPISQKALTLRQ